MAYVVVLCMQKIILGSRASKHQQKLKAQLLRNKITIGTNRKGPKNKEEEKNTHTHRHTLCIGCFCCCYTKCTRNNILVQHYIFSLLYYYLENCSVYSFSFAIHFFFHSILNGVLQFRMVHASESK